MELSNKQSTVQVKNAWRFISATHCAFVDDVSLSRGTVFALKRSRFVYVLYYFRNKQ